jgi:hypothetical protein
MLPDCRLPSTLLVLQMLPLLQSSSHSSLLLLVMRVLPSRWSVPYHYSSE